MTYQPTNFIETICCRMECLNKATKFQVLDYPEYSITNDGKDHYCYTCYVACVGGADEEEVEEKNITGKKNIPVIKIIITPQNQKRV